MPLNRTWLNSLVDDDGSGNTGTPWNKAQVSTFHDVIDAGTVPPALHANGHTSPGGADPLPNVTPTHNGLVPPLPSDATKFFRGDGTWAAPVAGAPQLHAVSHLQDGSDPISNVSSVSNGLAPKCLMDLNAFLRSDGQWAQLLPAAIPPHASHHQVGGGDAVDVKLLAGFPGGATTFLRGDGTFAAPPSGGGAGDVVGPASSTDNALPRFDGTTGKLIQSSLITVDDSGSMTLPDGVNLLFGPSAPGYIFGQNVAGGALHFGAGGLIYFDIAGSVKYFMYPLAFFSANDATCDLGTSGNRFKDGYFSGTVTIAGGKALAVAGGFPGGTTAFLRADGTFAAPAGGGGSGDVVGPASAVDTQIARFNGTTGKLIKASNVTIDDGGVLVAAGLGGTPLNGSQVNTGTIADARLTANVLKVSGGFPGTRSSALCGDGTFQPRTGVAAFIIDGAGAVIATGVKGFLEIPFAGTISGVTVLSTDAAATAGSIVVDIWKDTFANYPPTVADSICASAKPTLSSANKSKDTTLTGWTKTVNAGDVLGFNVDSAATVTRVLVSLTIVAN